MLILVLFNIGMAVLNGFAACYGNTPGFNWFACGFCAAGACFIFIMDMMK